MSGAEGLVLVAVVLGLVFAESAVLLDLIVPGEVGLLVAGAAAARNDTPLLWVVAAAAIGAVAGDCVGFAIGRRFGTDQLHRWRLTRHLADDLDDARRRFDRHGGALVAAARWIGALRAVVPVVAGSSELSLGRMLAWSIPSAVAWSAAVATAGYAFGDDIAGVVDRVGLIVSALAIALLLIAWRVLRHRRKARRAGEPDGAGPAAHPAAEADALS